MKTQAELIVDRLRKGERLTVAKALNELGIYALSQRCGELRKRGFNIQSQIVYLASGKRCKEYWI